MEMLNLALAAGRGLPPLDPNARVA